MKIIVCGGRSFTDRDLLFRELDRLYEEYAFTTVIHGGARGADSMAGDWAKARGIFTSVFLAQWKKWGYAAGPLRNTEMLRQRPDLVVAFPGGAGTMNMVTLARRQKVPVIEIPRPPEDNSTT